MKISRLLFLLCIAPLIAGCSDRSWCWPICGGDSSSGVITVTGLTVTSPKADVSWQKGSAYTIKWDTQNGGNNVRILLYKSGIHSENPSFSTANDGSFSWTIPSTIEAGSNYKIRIMSHSNDVNAYSDIFYILN